MTELVGRDILYRKWDALPPAASPKAVFLLVHGLGAHTARWDFLAGISWPGTGFPRTASSSGDSAGRPSGPGGTSTPSVSGSATS